MVKIAKIFFVVAIVIISIWLYAKVDLLLLKHSILSFGILAPLGYILAFIILPIFFFPVPILAICAGSVFGLYEGSFYTIIGAMINSLIMFYLSRFLGFKSVQELAKSSKNKILHKFKNFDNKFWLILILRLIPFVPYNGLNYACGLMDISLKDYINATFIGILPATIILVNLGEKAQVPNTIDFIIASILTLLLVVGSSFLMKFLKQKG